MDSSFRLLSIDTSANAALYSNSLVDEQIVTSSELRKVVDEGYSDAIDKPWFS